MSISRNLVIRISVLCFCSGALCSGQDPSNPAPDQKPAPDAATPPATLPTPPFTVRCKIFRQRPSTLDLWVIYQLNGTLSGMGVWQSNHVPGDEPTQAALSNGQIFLQKTDGWFQFTSRPALTTFRPRSALSSHRQNDHQLLWAGSRWLS